MVSGMRWRGEPGGGLTVRLDSTRTRGEGEGGIAMAELVCWAWAAAAQAQPFIIGPAPSAKVPAFYL